MKPGGDTASAALGITPPSELHRSGDYSMPPLVRALLETLGRRLTAAVAGAADAGRARA